jgi:hypothetical protein
VREQLQKHRESAACRSCHAHIDPPGFALESFDAIGRWRGHYNNTVSLPVDASGVFRSAKFKDVGEFKNALLAHPDMFGRCLVEKLLVHALGRELEITDRPHVRHILEAASKDGYRLRDIVLLCAASELMRKK